MPNRIVLATALILAATSISRAGDIIIGNPLTFTGGAGTTVYGATGYTCPGGVGNCTPVGPQFISNNLTGDDDILTSPGSGYQVANPVIGNNVAETPNGGIGLPDGSVNASNPTPYTFSAAGGSGGLSGAPFGTGITVNSGPGVGFALTDTSPPGCCTASYMITSWTSDYTVGAAGFNGAFNAYLGITGVNQTANDAAVASLVVSYSANGGAYIPLTDMLVAEAGNCNDVLTGDATGEINAACSNGRSGGAFAAAAVDTSAVLTLNAGQTLDFESTLTVYADPANFDSIDSSLDGLLLPELSLSAPNILVGDDDAEPTPEPATLLLVGAGLASLGLLRRRKPS